MTFVMLVVGGALLLTAHSCHREVRSSPPAVKPEHESIARGLEALEKKDFLEARFAFQTAARELPEDPRPCFLEGAVHFSRYLQNNSESDLERAEECFDEALDRDVHHRQTMVWRGLCYLSRGMDERGLTMIEQTGEYASFAKRIRSERKRGLVVRFHPSTLGPNLHSYDLGPGVRGVRLPVPFRPKER